jgi:hypothetical protein
MLNYTVLAVLEARPMPLALDYFVLVLPWADERR